MEKKRPHSLYEDQRWYLFEQKLPEYIYTDLEGLVEAIEENETKNPL